jgi:hypothetical protein
VSERIVIGARIGTGGRLRTIGLAASAEGREYAVTTSNLLPLLDDERCVSGIPAAELLTAIPLRSPAGPPEDERFTIAELARPGDLLDEVVRWFHPEAGRVQGLVTALHGAVRLEVGERFLVARELIEVEFSSSGGEAELPLLGPSDSGALVTTWEGAVAGLVVAAAGARAFIVPARPFLDAHGLVHRRVSRDAGICLPGIGAQAVEKEAGIASQRVELEHEGSFGLESFLEAA